MKHKFICFAALILSALPAWAHTSGMQNHGFSSGLTHPIFGLDHLLTIIGIGLLSLRFQSQRIWLLPLLFAVSMAIGLLLGHALGAAFFVEPLIVLGVGLAGLALALGKQMPALFWGSAVGLIGLPHGWAHGVEMGGASLITFSLGMLTATLGLLALGCGLGTAIEKWTGRLGWQATGAALICFGVFQAI